MKRNLYGHGKKCNNKYTGKPSEKQLNIIKKLRSYYGNEIPNNIVTFKQAWEIISKYSDKIQYDESKNEFYIEGNVVGFISDNEQIEELEVDGFKKLSDDELDALIKGNESVEDDIDITYSEYEDSYDPGDDFEEDWIRTLE